MAGKKVGLIFVPGPGSHITSTVEAAKRILIHNHSISDDDHQRTFSIIMLLMNPPAPGSSIQATTSFTDSVSSSGIDLRFELLPPVEDHELKDTEGFHDLVHLQFLRHKPHVKDVLRRCLSSMPVAALVIDAFSIAVMDAAQELGVPVYLYFCSSAAMIGFVLHLYTLDEYISSDFGDVKEGIQVPGISMLPPSAVPSFLASKKSKSYAWSLYLSRRCRELEGIIVNTFAELEPAPTNALAAGLCTPGHPTPPVYTIGPAISTGFSPDSVNCGDDWFAWLKSQPVESVVYMCFGSKGELSASQLKEIATGLERSGHRFLWCLRNPSNADGEQEQVLPEGFQERTKKRGMVLMNWVPQAQILAQPAVGGFVTHCGWNSILESLWFGVPMLPWPLAGEQPVNALDIVKDINVAVNLNTDYGGFVSAEELARGINCLLGNSNEGNIARAKAKALQEASRKAVERGGSSFESLSQLIDSLAAVSVN